MMEVSRKPTWDSDQPDMAIIVALEGGWIMAAIPGQGTMMHPIANQDGRRKHFDSRMISNRTVTCFMFATGHSLAVDV